MSLITCCPSCGTKFRVVTDQLRISEGWVRCGRCQEVFDATQALQVPTDIAAAASAVPVAPKVLPQTGPAVAETLPEPEPAAQGYELPSPPDTHDAPDEAWLDAPGQTLPASAPSMAARMQQTTEPLQAIALEQRPWAPEQALPAEEVQALTWAQALSEPQEPSDSLAVPESAMIPAPESAASPHGDDDAEELIPSFVKQAQRKAWWSQPAVRFAMGMLVIFLPLALLLQIAMHERNTLVAWKPQWRPAFASMCVALRCELAPRKSIASVVLTGSSFNQDVQPHHYRLGLSMQNQAPTSVATPAVELTLTDSQGQVLVRKVFNPSEIAAPLELAARSEWNGTLPVMTQGLHLPVSGYRVMAFYP